MAQITEAQRKQRIAQLLKDLNKVPPERHEVARLPWTGGEPLLCPVIKIGVDEVLLNHQSHRIRAQLEDDVEWREIGRDPHSERAQKLIERHVRDSRSADEFKNLKESLAKEGQTDPGVMTHLGVLVNANTRVVALRELEDPNKRYIRVAVLPETAQPKEHALLELRLQMQKDLKVEYSLTNELLFIEELSTERGLSDAQIARELRIFPESEKKGPAEVAARLRMLDLIRQMQKIPLEPLPLTFFDSLGYQQLRELDRAYHARLEEDKADALAYMESFLLSVAVGVTPVHQVRKIDPDFMPEYMLPQLQDDEGIGTVVDQLVTPDPSKGKTRPKGVTTLVGPQPDREAEELDVRKLLNVVTQRDKRVEIPGSSVVLQKEDVVDAVKSAIITGIDEKKRDAREEDKLEAPIDALKNATKQIGKCTEALHSVVRDAEYDEKRRKSLEAAFKRLKRTYRDLETALVKSEVISKG